MLQFLCASFKKNRNIHIFVIPGQGRGQLHVIFRLPHQNSFYERIQHKLRSKAQVFFSSDKKRGKKVFFRHSERQTPGFFFGRDP